MTNGFFFKTPFLLFPDEKLIFKTRPHWLYLALPIISLTGVWLFYLLFLCPYAMEFTFEGVCFLLSSIAFPFVILIFFLDWNYNRIYLTNFRLVKERGFLGKRFMSIFLEQVEDVTISYGILGRLFNFGDLEIESAGTYGQMVFKGVPGPEKIKRLIGGEVFKIKR